MAKEYTHEYKLEAVKLAKKIGVLKASEELGVPKGTLYGWVTKEKNRRYRPWGRHRNVEKSA